MEFLCINWVKLRGNEVSFDGFASFCMDRNEKREYDKMYI